MTKENIAKFGVEPLMQKVLEIMDTAPPKCEVRLKGATYSVNAVVGDDSRITLMHPYKKRKRVKKTILSDIDAIFKPGTMTLVRRAPNCSLLPRECGNICMLSSRFSFPHCVFSFQSIITLSPCVETDVGCVRV